MPTDGDTKQEGTITLLPQSTIISSGIRAHSKGKRN